MDYDNLIRELNEKGLEVPAYAVKTLLEENRKYKVEFGGRTGGKTQKRREIASSVAWSYMGTPYRWGGDDPSGLDCSGLCVEILKSVGLIGLGTDYTAAGLYEKFFTNHSTLKASEGRLAFFWNKSNTRVVHVEYCIDNSHTIGASGGGSKTTTEEKAWQHNAYVKVRPINHDRGRVSFVDPFVRREV